MKRASPWCLGRWVSHGGRGRLEVRHGQKAQGYSTGAEMALEMFQPGKRPAAIFARQGFPMSGGVLLPHFPGGSSLVLHRGL